MFPFIHLYGNISGPKNAFLYIKCAIEFERVMVVRVIEFEKVKLLLVIQRVSYTPCSPKILVTLSHEIQLSLSLVSSASG